jgi:hypothetical protein
VLGDEQFRHVDSHEHSALARYLVQFKALPTSDEQVRSVAYLKALSK